MKRRLSLAVVKQSLFPTESPGERKYASSLVGNLKPFFRESQI